jgi:GMP synthase-like glutamine amidotransferase
VSAAGALVASAVAQDVPVLGLCYGGQVLADVLGGVVEPAPKAELGWQMVESQDPEQVPAGPHLGTQFHPESTIEIVKHWASGRDGAETARANAFQLFDVFWERAQRPERSDP